MAWIFLVIAGFAEVGGVLSMKLSEGFKKLLPSILCIIFGAISFYLLSLSVKTLPVGTAYAIWTGIGSAGSVLVGMLFFSESKDRIRIFLISGIIISIAGLKLVS
jgi:quaternary ammonium compound-resistance protein SugE